MRGPGATEASEVWGVLLAAGPSRRFAGGLPKQLVELDGEPLVRRAAGVALASRLATLVVVVGHAAPEVRRALSGLPVRLVHNSDYRRGQSTSVRAGLAALGEGAAAALFLTADQPALTASILDRIVEAFRRTGGPIVVPSFAGRRGSPVLFARELFPELAGIEGDAGGRQLFDRYADRIVEVELESAAPLADVDTMEDLRRLGNPRNGKTRIGGSRPGGRR